MVQSILEKAFYPKSIAVIGASSNPAKLGYRIVEAVVTDGFKGKVYPVNVKGEEVFSLKAYRNVLEIPSEVDLALIAIPANFVPEAIRECGEKKIECAVVFSAGFGEIRNGVKLEQELIDAAAKFNVRIIGPNTNGILNLNNNLNATFTPNLKYKKGNVAFVCQSGGYSSVLLRYGSDEGVGFSKVINLGNSCDIGFADVIEYLATDKFTKVIVLYMEGFKHKNEGRKFYEVAKKVTKIKPIVAFKVGQTKAGTRAALSHTGSLAGLDELYSSAFKQAGVIRASDGIEMIDIAKALSLQQNLPRGKDVAIITNLGGPGVVAADICESHGVLISELSEATKGKLSKILSFTASYANPIDLAADWPNLYIYKEVLSAALEDERINGVLIVLYVLPHSEYRHLIKDISTISKMHGKPIVACCLSSDKATALKCIDELEKHSIPSYKMPENAAKALIGLVKYSTYLRGYEVTLNDTL
jgi:acetyl coenzyme A synthetase (ADP forming)-like protein